MFNDKVTDTLTDVTSLMSMHTIRSIFVLEFPLFGGNTNPTLLRVYTFEDLKNNFDTSIKVTNLFRLNPSDIQVQIRLLLFCICSNAIHLFS